MNVWDALNSPIVVTVVSLTSGSVIAAWITALWQKRSHCYETKLQFAQDIVSTYHEYVRLLKHDAKYLSDIDFDAVHSRLLSAAKVVSFLFRDKQVGPGWLEVASKLSSVRGLKLQGRDSTLIDRKLVEIFQVCDPLIEAMFREVSGLSLRV